MKTMGRIAGVVAVLTIPAIASAQAQKKDVDIKAPDGVNLKGTYFSPGRSGPAILLLHQCNMDRHAWDQLASDLANAGLHVLTVDFRGFGESGGDKMPLGELARTVIPQKFPADVDAAYAFLLAQKNVNKLHLAVGGASCGVTQSSALAARRSEIRTLMVLSGTASDETRSYIARTPGLAVFGAASEEDRNAAVGIKAILESSKNPQPVLKMYAGAEHGVTMLAKNPELEPMIVSWLRTHLSSKTTH